MSVGRWLTLLALFAASLVPTEAQSETDLGAGVFLVASRNLGDPNFAETVVLIVHYDEDNGAMGLIINRPTDVPLSRVFRDIKEAKGRTDPVYNGGPVEQGALLALLKSSTKPAAAAEKIFRDVYLVASRDLVIKTLTDKVEPSAFHAYLGYAGWAAGQLEHELELGGWQLLPADAASVFHAEPDSVWPRLIRRTEMRVARFDFTRPGGSTQSFRHSPPAAHLPVL